MKLKVGDLSYEWIENWARVPKTTGYAHHGMVVNKDGNIVTANDMKPKILILDPEGNLLDSFETPVVENHGICLAEENGQEVLYIADIAKKNGVDTGDAKGKVIKCDMRGKVLLEITEKDLKDFGDDAEFIPTTVAFDQDSGDLWIADGYGSSKIYKLNKDLKHVLTLDGTEGAGRFNKPHWVFLDYRKSQPRLYVADRSNDRVQVYNTDGSFIKSFGEGVFDKPSVFSTFENYLVIGELNARLALLDEEDELIGFIGAGPENLKKEGWPNRLDENGEKVAPQDLKPGAFNSPHGMAADSEGNIYVSEWLIGDRFTKLNRTAIN